MKYKQINIYTEEGRQALAALMVEPLRKRDVYRQKSK